MLFGIAGTMRKLGTAIAIVATRAMVQAWALLVVNGLYLICLIRNPYALRLVWPIDIAATVIRVAISVIVLVIGYKHDGEAATNESLGWSIVALEAAAIFGLLALQISLARPAFYKFVGAVNSMRSRSSLFRSQSSTFGGGSRKGRRAKVLEIPETTWDDDWKGDKEMDNDSKVFKNPLYSNGERPRKLSKNGHTVLHSEGEFEFQL